MSRHSLLHHLWPWSRYTPLPSVVLGRSRRRCPRARSHRAQLESLAPNVQIEAISDRGPLLRARNWACQLQGEGGGEINVDDVTMCDADAIIIDYSRDGSAARAFTPADLAMMKRRRDGRTKQIIAYMSIGEAEAARFYWSPSWVGKKGLTAAAPKWLYRPNEGGWEGNWRVKFWDPGWERIIIGDDQSFLNRIIDAGFDGVFLDIVEAGEYWADSDRGSDRRPSAEPEMVAFVCRIAHHARAVRGQRGFLVIPNGDFFLGLASYRAAISAVLREDILYIQEDLEPPRVSPRPRQGGDSVATIAAELNKAAPDNLPVLAIEYLMDRPEDRAKIPAADTDLRQLAPNVLPYFSVRHLDRLCAPVGITATS